MSHQPASHTWHGRLPNG